MRLPNGWGSVYKLPGKRRRPWVAVKTIGWKDDGKPIRKIIGYYRTRKEALDALANYNKNPYDINKAQITFRQLYNEWIFTIKTKVENGKLSNKRLNCYISTFKYYESIADTEFLSIKELKLQEIIDNCPHGYHTKMNIKILYNQLFNYAKRIDVPLKKNYSEFVEVGERKKSSLHRPFLDEEILKLWDNIDNIKDIDTVLIMCNTGIRPNELLTIETENVHLEEHYMVGGSKTDAGKNRIIPINDDIYKFVKKRYNPANKYLVMKQDGTRWLYNAYLERFREIMSTLNMQHLPHDGRHTFATKMDELMANKICVKLIMGHIIQDITDGTYTHKSIQNLLDTVNLFKKVDLKINTVEKV